jgi:hypothetical protein
MEGVVAFAGMFSLWIALTWLACGFLSAHVAAEKERWAVVWFVLGVLFGPIALLAIVGLPDNSASIFTPSVKTHVTCPDCAEFVRKKANKCPHCGCKLTPQT